MGPGATCDRGERRFQCCVASFGREGKGQLVFRCTYIEQAIRTLTLHGTIRCQWVQALRCRSLHDTRSRSKGLHVRIATKSTTHLSCWRCRASLTLIPPVAHILAMSDVEYPVL